MFQDVWCKPIKKKENCSALKKCERSISKLKYQTHIEGEEIYSVHTSSILMCTHKEDTQNIRTEQRCALLRAKHNMRTETPTDLKTPLKGCILSGEEEAAVTLSSTPRAKDTLLTLLTQYSKAPERVAAKCPRGWAVPERGGCRYRLKGTNAELDVTGQGRLSQIKMLTFFCRITRTYSLTCIAPMFSISCSVLDAPKRTELTPSFRRHHAARD